jgi:MoxR-like ATPase
LQALILGAKIRAILDSRYHVAREDLRLMAKPVLRHRMILNFEGQAEGMTSDEVIEQILKTLSESAIAA